MACLLNKPFASSTVVFIPPVINKRISYFFNSNLKQLSIICSEVMLWDGCIKDNVFVSNYKEDVDFVQYAFATQGYRTSINNDFRKNKITYRCIVSEARPRVQLGGSPKTDINIVKSVDGFYKGYPERSFRKSKKFK